MSKLNTGFFILDRICGGFERGNVVLLSGLRGGGRTNFALNMALNQARGGLNVVYVSPGENHAVMRRKVSASLSGIPLSSLWKTTSEMKRHVKMTANRVSDTFKLFCPTNGTFDETLEAMTSLPTKPDVLMLDDLDIEYWSGRARTRHINKIKKAAGKHGIVILAVVADRLTPSDKTQRLPKTLKANSDHWLRIVRSPGTTPSRLLSAPHTRSVMAINDFQAETGPVIGAYVDSDRCRVILNVGSEENIAI